MIKTNRYNPAIPVKQIRLANEDGVIFKTYTLLSMQIDENSEITIVVR